MPVKRAGKPKTASNSSQTGITATVLTMSALALIAVLAYANSLHGDFVFDDQQIVLQNPLILNIHSLADVVKAGMGWRQLLFLSYGFNYYWSGQDTSSYHALNLAFHILNVWLVYGIILQCAHVGLFNGTRQDVKYAAVVGGAIFAVHPLLSSAVGYIAGRSSVLCAVFYFLATLLFLMALDERWRPGQRILFLVLTIAAGVIAWQAKQEAITLPALFAALMWIRSEKKNFGYILGLAVLPLVLAASMWEQIQGLFTTVTENKVLINAGFEPVLKPLEYFRTYISAIVGYYFPRFLFPANLNADPHILPVTHWYSPEFIFAVAVLLALTWLIVRPRSSGRLVSVGVGALLLSPLSAYALIPLADVALEHRAYIPGLGFAFLSAAFFLWVARQYPALRTAAPAIVVIVFGIMTLQHNPVFASNIALWRDTVQKSPRKPRAHFNLGAAYQNAQRPNEAIHEYEIALSLRPDINAAYSNIAAIQIDEGRLDEGEKTLLKLTQLAPEYPEGFINLAVLYIRKREPEKAVAMCDHAIVLNSAAFAAHYNRAEALSQMSRYAEALESYKRAIYIRPDLPSFKMALGAAYVKAGDFDGAEKTFRELTDGALAAEAWRNLATIYESVGKSDTALEYLGKAIYLKPLFPDAHHDLGVIYLKRNMVDQAINELSTTLQQQPDYVPAVLNLSLAYQTKGDKPSARNVLQRYLTQYPGSRSEYLPQLQARLASLQ